MTLALAAGSLRTGNAVVLDGVSAELVSEPGRHGVFLHLRAERSASRHRICLGSIPALERFVACHRFEPYWMKPAVGCNVSEVPAATQFFLGRLRGLGWLLVVPLVADPFCCSLDAGRNAALELLAETGCARLAGQTGLAAYVALGADPFSMLRACSSEVALRLGGKLRRDKSLPDFVAQFGWCTWDAFYAEVSAAKVQSGLEALAAGGITPKFLILDDGWLDVRQMPTGEMRLDSFRANEKFEGGLARLTQMAKQAYGVRTVLVWHTIVGYWGGITQGLSQERGYAAVEQVRHFGEGVLAHAPRANNEWWGELVGFVPPGSIARFFDDYHGTLSQQGVDGVKVDSQAVLEALSQGQGGRMQVSRAYREALEASVSKYFRGRLIHCMSHAPESWYGAAAPTLARGSIDYFPARPETHGPHVYANAVVGLWFGQFVQPDWDMFQSVHPMAAFHAAARAISGGPVYVSDKPGAHDFELLGKLVCSDGSVLLADQPALPTLDSLLMDPAREAGLLKIWNRNGPAAIVGVFNCNVAAPASAALAGQTGPADVPGLEGERFAVYAHCAGTLRVASLAERWQVTLAPGCFELYTLVPLEEEFAAVGLANMFNSRAAVSGESWRGDAACTISLRDGGRFVACALRPPRALHVGEHSVPFTFDAELGRLDASLSVRGPVSLEIEW